jgi:hypothetical protein
MEVLRTAIKFRWENTAVRRTCRARHSVSATRALFVGKDDKGIGIFTLLVLWSGRRGSGRKNPPPPRDVSLRRGHPSGLLGWNWNKVC